MRNHFLRAAAGAAEIEGWDLTKATYNGTPINWFFLGTTSDALFFSPDGTKMYTLNATSVDEYTLSAAWDVTTASYIQNFSVAAQEANPSSLFFSTDGTKMYVIGTNGDDVNEYDLSTAWNISTAVYLQNFSISAQETSPQGLFFKPDGTKMYVIGMTGDDVNEYDLSTAWDVSTASYVQAFSISAQETNPQDLFFKPDGTKMYIIGTTGDDVNEYNLSTAWDVSTASYVRNFSVSNRVDNPRALFFKSDGTKMYVVGTSTSNNVSQYDLSTAWNISTASFTFPSAEYFSVAAQEINPRDLFFKPDGTKMYIIGGSGNDVNEYDLSTPWNVSTASYIQNFSISGQELNPQGLFFSTDGTKMYVVGATGDDVNEYSLSTAWDVSTASYVQVFSVATQETNPNGLFFKPDGTKMYITGNTGRDVNEYDLSTAWDVSTASYVQVFSVAAQEISPQGLFFKPDGTKMYIIGSAGDDVNEYDLSTEWDISTSSYLQNFPVAVYDRDPSGVFFKPDGTKMYIVGSSSDAVWSFDL